MAYNNADRAVIVPNLVTPEVDHQMDRLYQRSERTRLEQEAAALKAQTRKDALVKLVGSEFQDKNFLSGTANDPYVNKRLAETKQKYMAEIMSNPNVDYNDIYFRMQKDVGDFNAEMNGIKTVKAQIDEQAKRFGADKDIDAATWGQLATNEYLYKTDEKTGAKILRPIAERDPNVNYMDVIRKKHPELLTHGDEGFRNYIKGHQLVDMGNSGETTDKKGIKHTRKYDMALPNYMEPVKAADGWPTDVKVRTQNIDGMEVADEGVYNSFMTKPSVALHIDTMFKERNAALKDKAIPEDSPEAEIMKRKILLDELNAKKVYKFKPGEAEIQRTPLALRDAGYHPDSYYRSLERQQDRDQAKLDKEDNRDPAIVYRGMAGDRTVTEGLEPEEINGQTMYNVVNKLGGVKLGKDVDGKPVYASAVYVDPKNNSMAVTEQDGETTVYKGADARKFWAEVAPYNTVPLDKMTAISDRYIDRAGNFIGKIHTEDIAELEGKNEARNFKADKEFAEKQNAITEDSSEEDLEFLEGNKLNDGGKIKKAYVRGMVKRGLGFGLVDKYKIDVETADGNTKSETFSTLKAMNKWLTQNRAPKFKNQQGSVSESVTPAAPSAPPAAPVKAPVKTVQPKSLLVEDPTLKPFVGKKTILYVEGSDEKDTEYAVKDVQYNKGEKEPYTLLFEGTNKSGKRITPIITYKTKQEMLKALENVK